MSDNVIIAILTKDVEKRISTSILVLSSKMFLIFRVMYTFGWMTDIMAENLIMYLLCLPVRSSFYSRLY